MSETEGGEDRTGQGGGPGRGESRRGAQQRQNMADETKNSDRTGEGRCGPLGCSFSSQMPFILISIGSTQLQST